MDSSLMRGDNHILIDLVDFNGLAILLSTHSGRFQVFGVAKEVEFTDG